MREIHHVGLTRYSIIRGSLIVTGLKYNHDHNFYHNSLHWFLRLICNFLKSVSKPFHYVKHNPKIKKLKQDKAQQFRTIGRHCQPSLCGTSLHCPRGPMQPQSYSGLGHGQGHGDLRHLGMSNREQDDILDMPTVPMGIFSFLLRCEAKTRTTTP